MINLLFPLGFSLLLGFLLCYITGRKFCQFMEREQ